jgi:hypothetical protein
MSSTARGYLAEDPAGALLINRELWGRPFRNPWLFSGIERLLSD